MSKYLVIVESPTKARTISSILGKDYEIVSSMGHIVDLPSNKLSVDVGGRFSPIYQVIPGKEKIIDQLKKKSKNKKVIYLATDPDREGEAISWHIKEKLSEENKNRKFSRVVFHEITEDALHEAFKKHGSLDTNRVNAQMARRVLDRVVGYSLSPFLWKKVVRGLSAGRVQSIALKFVTEREKSIIKFEPETTFSIEAKFKAGDHTFRAGLAAYQGKKVIFKDKAKALECIRNIKTQNFTVKGVRKKEIIRKPPSPHITSLLQQDSFNRLRFSAQKTMLIAQKLYEGAEMGDKSVGFITYMRTDSFHVNPKAKKEVKEFIRSSLGEDYLSLREYRYRKKKGAQLAHESIHPTSVYRKPQELVDFLSDDEFKLYDLIWKRFIASFMREAKFENTKAFIASEEAEFEASGRKIVFEGYLKILGGEQEQSVLPSLEKGEGVVLEDLEVAEHITKPPPRYNDASLIRLLEEKGIGRPSTYAPIVYTLIRRNYIRQQKRYYIPTDLGIKVSDLLIKFFPQVMDENFTAFLEEKLDEVEKGMIEWHKILEDFYPSFKKKVEETLLLVKKEVEYSEKNCPQCKARLVIKWSRRGRFLSCEKFPKCRYAESITTGVHCPGCREGLLIERRNKRGQNFYGCSKFPNCTYTARTLPETEDEKQAAKEDEGSRT